MSLQEQIKLMCGMIDTIVGLPNGMLENEHQLSEEAKANFLAYTRMRVVEHNALGGLN